MSVKVKLFGKFRKLISEFGNSGLGDSDESIGLMEMSIDRIEKISDIIEKLGLEEDEVSHLFLNWEYSSLDREISDGDRVSIFPREMALLYKWYFPKKGS